MKQYSAYWRATILAAIAFHLLAGLAFAFVLPEIFPVKTIQPAEEFTWLDVDLAEDLTVEELPVETIPVSEFPELKLPELVIPETVFEPLPKLPELPPRQEIVPTPVAVPTPPPLPTPPPVVKVEPPPKVEPVVEKPVEPVEESEPEPEPEDEDDEDLPPQMGEPPETIEEFYPKAGSGLGYKGYVSVAVRIGTNGEVLSTRIMRSSGRMMVDGLAQDYAKKWKFKPALDQNGNAMECDKIITFDFKKFA